MDYKGLTIVPAVAAWLTAGDWGYRFRVIKRLPGGQIETVHFEERMIGPFPDQSSARQAAIKAARDLIDANGPYSF